MSCLLVLIELTNKKYKIGKNHVRIMLKDVFVSAKHQRKATDGLGFTLTITRNKDNSVLNKVDATSNSKSKSIGVEWCVPHCTPSVEQQEIISAQILRKTARELQYVEKSIL